MKDDDQVPTNAPLLILGAVIGAVILGAMAIIANASNPGDQADDDAVAGRIPPGADEDDPNATLEKVTPATLAAQEPANA